MARVRADELADPIDVNRTAEALGLTGRDIPPNAWPGEWLETGPSSGTAAAGGPNGDGVEDLPADADGASTAF